MTGPILSFQQVSKRWGAHEVLKDVSFTLDQCKCIALTGLNGSGKTTILKLAAGLTRASGGHIVRQGAGSVQYVPERFPALASSARSILRSFGAIKGMRPAALKEKIEELLCAFHLEKEADFPLRSYSKGMLQKVAIIQAFLCRADVLLLDEPLSGQDEASQETFIQMTGSALSSGMAVLLACHERSLINRLADTVFELRDGVLHAAGAQEDEGEDIYLFEAPREGFEPPADMGDPIRSETKGRMMSLAVLHGTGSQMLKIMLDAGWGLREMRHEKNR